LVRSYEFPYFHLCLCNTLLPVSVFFFVSFVQNSFHYPHRYFIVSFCLFFYFILFLSVFISHCVNFNLFLSLRSFLYLIFHISATLKPKIRSYLTYDQRQSARMEEFNWDVSNMRYNNFVVKYTIFKSLHKSIRNVCILKQY
jgi:hypothetical protein